MRASLSDFFTSLFDLLAPPRASEEALRALTIEDLFSLSDPEGALPYKDRRVRALIWELKYHARGKAAALAGEYLADTLLALAAEEAFGTPLLIPIPMHPERRKARGHNQTELLCEAALKVLRSDGIFSYAPNVLERIRHTPQQQGLIRSKRLKNVNNSMRVVDSTKVKDRACIIIDDVSTTGATFAEARRALLDAGASKVECVALAH